jgi:hemoglobin-like flavoprotein
MGQRKSVPILQDEQSCISEICTVMMPLYYHGEPVTEEHIVIASNTWNKILNNTASGLTFLERPEKVGERSNPFINKEDGFIRFREQFFSRYFFVEPGVEHMFSLESIENGGFLGSMIHKCLSQISDAKAFRSGMVKLATDHIRRGVWATQYGIVGEILFWSLQRCLGVDYTREVEVAWKIVFSSVLRVMVPVAVYFEKNRAIDIADVHPKASTRPPAFQDEETIDLAVSLNF